MIVSEACKQNANVDKFKCFQQASHDRNNSNLGLRTPADFIASISVHVFKIHMHILQ